mmetsp:Transcript_65156/g.188916  ORF Transcript_65156/g.188916 Transcript_65156/m.188916 type:complete len:228 (-) Transcript_65156:483-1166(-)
MARVRCAFEVVAGGTGYARDVGCHHVDGRALSGGPAGAVGDAGAVVHGEVLQLETFVIAAHGDVVRVRFELDECGRARRDDGQAAANPGSALTVLAVPGTDARSTLDAQRLAQGDAPIGAGADDHLVTRVRLQVELVHVEAHRASRPVVGCGRLHVPMARKHWGVSAGRVRGGAAEDAGGRREHRSEVAALVELAEAPEVARVAHAAGFGTDTVTGAIHCEGVHAAP